MPHYTLGDSNEVAELILGDAIVTIEEGVYTGKWAYWINSNKKPFVQRGFRYLPAAIKCIKNVNRKRTNA